jgi:hypothetical protein
VHQRYQQHWWQIAAGINDTGGKFATIFATVVDTGGKQWEQLSNCWQLKMYLKNFFNLCKEVHKKSYKIF